MRWLHEKRRAPRRCPSGTSIARRTWLGSYRAEVQADPLEMATRSRRTRIAASASRLGKATFSMCGRARLESPEVTGARGARAWVSRDRISLQRWRRGSALVAASSAARPNPTMSGTGWVPGRSPRSWPPPWRSGSSGGRVRSRWRAIRAPMPLGAYSLWPLMLMRSILWSRRGPSSLPKPWAASTWR